MPKKPTPKAAEFMAANDVSLVVEGRVLDMKKGGGVYKLYNGATYKLTVDDCRSLPPEYPKWGF